jgi:hypothetical protein
MSWDIYISDLPDVGSIKEVPTDFVPRPIGRRDQLVQRMLDVLPIADRVDADWLFVKSNGIDLSIQLHMEDADQVRYLLVHVHGGEQSAACVAALLRHLGLRGHDTATGEFFDANSLDERL